MARLSRGVVVCHVCVCSVLNVDALVVVEDFVLPKVSSPGGSSTSSRDGSPNRDVSPLTRNLNPPVVLKRGTKGFGFGFRSVRVYIGETNVYMLQHIVTVSGLGCSASSLG